MDGNGGEMRMKEITLYKCDICGTEYKFAKDAEACEKYHIQPIKDSPFASAMYKPYRVQSCEPYPYKITVKMEDGKTLIYKR